MTMITTKDGTKIFYKDWGHGHVLLAHTGSFEAAIGYTL